MLTVNEFLLRPRSSKRAITQSTENKMNDIERLIDSTFPFVEDLLTKHGEFFPIASAVKTNGSIAQVGTYDGDDKPLSEKLIADLKAAFIAKKVEYKAVAIFYDVRVVDPDTKIKTDAIAVFIESKNEKQAYTFYYPYSLTTEYKLIFSDPWKSEKEKEVFIE